MASSAGRGSPSPSARRAASQSPSPRNENKTIAEVRAASLLAHKYSSDNKSILARPMGQFWEGIATVLPLWMSPNMVTTVGAVCSWITIFMIDRARGDPAIGLMVGGKYTVQDYSMFRNLYWGAGFLLWTYNTLDNVDGKLARLVRSPHFIARGNNPSHVVTWGIAGVWGRGHDGPYL